MTKQLTTLRIFGNKTSDNTIDFLIYLPHSSLDADWQAFARSTFQIARDDISDDLFQLYIYHEADIGMREVAESCIQNLEDIPFSIGILEMNIPRALCDMNRPFSRSIPPLMHQEKWQKTYDTAMSEISEVLARSRFCLQLHSMCSFDCILPLQFNQEVSVLQIQEFLTTGYSGKRRECTILTSDTLGNYKSSKYYDSLLVDGFQKNNVVLEQDTTYQLLSDYPATKIMENMSSSLLEITKGSLATEETKNSINTSNIEFDNRKINSFGKILATSIRQFIL